MKALNNSCVAFWTLIIGIAAALYGAMMLFGMAVAHADPAVAGDRHAPQPAALGDTAVTWLLAGLVILKVVEMALDRIAPLTKTTVDDRARDAIHSVRETAEEILSHVKPGSRAASGTIESKDVQ